MEPRGISKMGKRKMDVGDDVVTRDVVDVEPGGALVVGVGLIPLREEALQRFNILTMRNDMSYFKVLTARLLICLVSTVVLGTASGQAPTWDPTHQNATGKIR